MMAEIFDVNSMYDTPAARLLAAKRALRSTIYGTGRVLRVELNASGFVEFVSNVSGRAFSRVEDAMSELDKIGMSTASKIRMSDIMSRDPSRLAGNRIAGLAGFGEAIGKAMQDPTSRALLNEAGLSDDFMNNFLRKGSISVGTLSEDEKVIRSIAGDILDDIKSGKQMGIPLIDPKGGRIINFLAEGQALTYSQANALMSIAGVDPMNFAGFDDLDAGVGRSLGKLGKRLKLFFAERDLSISTGQLDIFMDKKENFMFKPREQILGVLSGIRDFGDARLNEFYGDADGYVRSYGEYLDGVDSQTMQKIESLVRGGSSADEILRQFDSDEITQGKIRNLFEAIERDDDGSILINDKNRRSFISYLKDIAEDLEGRGKYVSYDQEQQLLDIRRQIRLLELGGESVTVGYSYADNVGSVNTVKGAARFDRFSSAFKDVAMIYSDISVKKESGATGRASSLVLSGFGEESDRVAADIGTSSFLQDILVNKENAESIKRNEQRVLAEVREMADTGIVPKPIKEFLFNAADQDLSLVDPVKGPAARRNKEFAQEIVRLIQSGVKVSEIPQAMSMISKMYAAEAYRFKDDMVLPVMPDYQRLAIDTELSFRGTRTKSLIKDPSSIVNIQSSTMGTQSAELFNFRIKGHTMFTGIGSVGRIRETLGGYDLDDHILRNIVTYNDENGANRLAFYIMRQPSGTEEYLLTRASADVETYQSIFGRYGNFVESAEELLAQTADAGERTSLQNLIDVMRSSKKDTMIDDLFGAGSDAGVESSAIKVLNQMGETLRLLDPSQSFSAGPLVLPASEVTSDAVAYVNRALVKLRIEESKVSIADEVIEMLGEQDISDSLKNKIGKAVSGSTVDLNVLDKTDFEIRGFLEQARQRKVLRTVAESGGNLGQFVNRTMVLGSFLGQYDQFLNTAGNDVGNFLLDKYRIPLIAQETGIDAAIQVAGSLRIIGAVNSAAMAGADISGILDDFGGQGAALSVEEVGSVITRKLGSIMGVASLTAEGSGMGLSSLILERKVSRTDMRILIQGAIEGIQDAMESGLSLASNAEDVLNDLRMAEQSEIDSRMREVILRNFTLDESGGYGRHSVNLIDRSLEYANFNAISNSLISRSNDRFMIEAYESASDEARRVGQLIVDKYADDYSSLVKITDDMSQLDSYVASLRRANIGEKILTDIRLATEVEGVSRSDLFSALRYQFNERRINIGMIEYQSQESADLLEDISRVNYVKRTQATASLRNATTDFVSTYLLQSMDPNQTVDDLAEIAKMELENLRSSLPYGSAGSMEESILESLAGEAADDMDAYTRQAVEAQANVVRAQIAEAGFDQNVIDDMLRLGTVSDVSGQTGEAAEFMQEAIAESVRDPDEVQEISRAKYKPILRDAETAKSYIGDLLQKPGFKKGMILAGIASAASFIYSGSKDRTQQDIQGPPLLPGGSAYDQMPTRIPQLPAIEDRMYSQGASYNVSINGSYDDAQRFNEAVQGMDNINYSTTMYNRIPDLSSNVFTRFMEYF